MSTQKSLMGRIRESDFLYDFKRSPVTVVSFVIVVMLILLAVFADLRSELNRGDHIKARWRVASSEHRRHSTLQQRRRAPAGDRVEADTALRASSS